MRKIFIFLLALVVLFQNSCKDKNETKNIVDYLSQYGYDIKNYRVICFVPADGCSSCINPSLEYSKSAGADFLLILTSIYSKSINKIIEQSELNDIEILIDAQNVAYKSGLVSSISPAFYLLKNGIVIDIIDLSTTLDKSSPIQNVIEYLSLK